MSARALGAVSVMAGRTIAVGNVHGCSLALRALVDAIDPGPDDLLVTLGDYIDRGPDSRGAWTRCSPWQGVVSWCRFNRQGVSIKG